MALESGGRVRRSERVAEQIIALIRDRDLQPGTLLPTETELMDSMHVGRSSVREALHALSALGLVEIRQGAGTFVRSPSPLTGPGAISMEIIASALAHGITEELLEARDIIEVRAARLAAQRATLRDITDLEHLVEAARTAQAGRQLSFLLSADFHLGVVRAAHNNVLEGFVASYVPILVERAAVLERLPGYTEWEIREHDAILQAIAAHDTRLAAARMRDHLKDMTIHYEHVAAAGLRLPQPRQQSHVEVLEAQDSEEDLVHG
jgi:GntR family transcriptional repressor for pyruvate dehydrogenase complex